MPARIAVVTWSMYGHIDQLADKVAAGLEKSGAVVERFAIQETLSEEVLKKMYAGGSLTPKYPIIKADDLTNFDGFIFGFPTRYGRAPAQVSQFFDQTGGLWAKGALVGKFGGLFTSTASQHGGQETTALTTLPFFAHHGIIYVPIGYAHPGLQENSAVNGGSAYGAGTIANGDGSRQPSTLELEIAEFQGEQFGKTVGTFVKGREFLASNPTQHIPASSALALGRAIPASTTAVTTAASQPKSMDNTTAVPAQAQEGYAVPSTEPTSTTATATDVPAPTALPIPEPVAAAAPGAPDAGPAVPIKQVEKLSIKEKEKAPKKKGGMFNCCGGSNID